MRWFIPFAPAFLAFGPIMILFHDSDPTAGFLVTTAPLLFSTGLSFALLTMFIRGAKQEQRILELEARLRSADAPSNPAPDA